MPDEERLHPIDDPIGPARAVNFNGVTTPLLDTCQKIRCQFRYSGNVLARLPGASLAVHQRAVAPNQYTLHGSLQSRSLPSIRYT